MLLLCVHTRCWMFVNISMKWNVTCLFHWQQNTQLMHRNAFLFIPFIYYRNCIEYKMKNLKKEMIMWIQRSKWESWIIVENFFFNWKMDKHIFFHMKKLLQCFTTKTFLVFKSFRIFSPISKASRLFRIIYLTLPECEILIFVKFFSLFLQQ